MRDGERLYRLVLLAYPPAFRRAFGREMLLIYRAQRRDGVVDSRYWLACVAEAVATAPRLWMDELRETVLAARGGMLMSGLLLVTGGLFETANSLVEFRGAAFGERDWLSQALLMVVIATGVLVTIAGLALIMRGRTARRLAWISAVTCLVAFSVTFAMRPMLSIAATALGIALPLALWKFPGGAPWPNT